MTHDPPQGRQADSRSGDWCAEAEEAIDPVMREAIGWFTVLSDGQAHADAQAAARRWLAASPAHQAAYRDVEAMWTGTVRLSGEKRARDAARRMNRRRFGQLALLAAVGAGAGLTWMNFRAGRIATAPGEQRLVALEDGSRIQMSGATELSVKISAAARKIDLHRGEAYFTVARGRTPFTVTAAAGTVEALGTQFDIAITGERTQVLVMEHAVRVGYADRSVTLRQGEKLIYRDRDLGVPQDANPQIDLAWREGKLVFMARPLGEVLEVLNRWSAERLTLVDGSLAAHPVTLIINIADVADVLPRLQDALPIRTRHVPLFGTLIYRA